MKSIETLIHQTLRTLHREGEDVIEIRALNVGRKGNTVAGYFTDYALAAKEAARLDSLPNPPSGIYVNLNTLHRGCIARSPNKLTESPAVTTSDVDIVARRWLLIDFDPVRPAGISASEAELQLAKERMEDFLNEDNVENREYVTACSGNGYHVLARIEPLADTDSIRFALAQWGQAYSDEAVHLDSTVYNPARITKLYSTMARKGYSMDDRPHRRSGLILGETPS